MSKKLANFVVDANFFISAFEKEPSNLTKFLSTIQDNIRIFITTNVLTEIRWYLRRRIKEPVQIIEIKLKEIKTVRRLLASKGIEHSDLNDLSNIVAANRLNAAVVTSDLKLIKICESLSITAYTSSAFVYMLMSECYNNDLQNFLYHLYDVILSDEIRHSIEKQSLYDPVIRIKKIQEHALSVLKEIKDRNIIEVHKSSKLQLTKEESELLELINEIGLEFPDFLQELEKNNLEPLKTELIEIYNELADRTTELRVQLLINNNDSIVLPLATRLKARILFLLCAIEFNLADINALHTYLTTLTEYATLFPEQIADFYMDIHLLRMIYFVIVNELERLKYYYSPRFHWLCEREGRKDLLQLTRALILASTIITSGLIEKETTIEGKDELSLLLQLGYLLLQTKQLEKAMLILYHTFYLAYRNRETNILRGVLELLIVLHYATNQLHSEELAEALENAKKLGIYDFIPLETNHELLKQQLICKEFVNIEQLKLNLRQWYYIYHAIYIIEEGKETTVLLLKNPYFPLRLALYIPTRISEYDLKIGRQIKVFQGEAKVLMTDEGIHNFDVDLIIKLKEGAKYVFHGPFGIKII